MRRKIQSTQNVPAAVVQANDLYQDFSSSHTSLSDSVDIMYQHYLNNFDLYLDVPLLTTLYGAMEKSWLTGDVYFLHAHRAENHRSLFADVYQEFNLAATIDYSQMRSTPPVLAGKKYRQELLINPQKALNWNLLPQSSVNSWTESMIDVRLSGATALALFHQRAIPERYRLIPLSMRTDVMRMKEYSTAINNIELHRRALNDMGINSGFGQSSLTPFISDALTLDPGAVVKWADELHTYIHNSGQVAEIFHKMYESTVHYISLIFMHIIMEKFGCTLIGGASSIPPSFRKNNSAINSPYPLLQEYMAGDTPVVIDVWDVVTDVMFNHEKTLDPNMNMSSLLQGDGHHFIAEGYAWKQDQFDSWNKDRNELEKLEKFLR